MNLSKAARSAFGKLGKAHGAKGGKNRAAALTAEQRSAIARKAAQARWAKKDSGRGE